MFFVRLGLALINLISRIYEEFKRKRYIRHGEEKARKQAETEQEKRIEKARNIRRNFPDHDRVHDDDPYRRD